MENVLIIGFAITGLTAIFAFVVICILLIRHINVHQILLNKRTENRVLQNQVKIITARLNGLENSIQDVYTVKVEDSKKRQEVLRQLTIFSAKVRSIRHELDEFQKAYNMQCIAFRIILETMNEILIDKKNGNKYLSYCTIVENKLKHTIDAHIIDQKDYELMLEIVSLVKRL